MEKQPATGTRRKILVVDDNAIIVKTLGFKLKSSGYDVLSAANGGEAVATVRREKPDLSLLDLNFPPDVAFGGGVAWDGFLVIDWLRRMDKDLYIPCIVITGSNAAQTDQRALTAGAVRVFHKPLDHDALLAAIRETLGPAAAT
jgi:CheY-like chemotaxis protein